MSKLVHLRNLHINMLTYKSVHLKNPSTQPYSHPNIPNQNNPPITRTPVQPSTLNTTIHNHVPHSTLQSSKPFHPPTHPAILHPISTHSSFPLYSHPTHFFFSKSTMAHIKFHTIHTPEQASTLLQSQPDPDKQVAIYLDSEHLPTIPHLPTFKTFIIYSNIMSPKINFDNIPDATSLNFATNATDPVRDNYILPESIISLGMGESVEDPDRSSGKKSKSKSNSKFPYKLPPKLEKFAYVGDLGNKFVIPETLESLTCVEISDTSILSKLPNLKRLYVMNKKLKIPYHPNIEALQGSSVVSVNDSYIKNVKEISLSVIGDNKENNPSLYKYDFSKSTNMTSLCLISLEEMKFRPKVVLPGNLELLKLAIRYDDEKITEFPDTLKTFADLYNKHANLPGCLEKFVGVYSKGALTKLSKKEGCLLKKVVLIVPNFSLAQNRIVHIKETIPDSVESLSIAFVDRGKLGSRLYLDNLKFGENSKLKSLKLSWNNHDMILLKEIPKTVERLSLRCRKNMEDNYYNGLALKDGLGNVCGNLKKLVAPDNLMLEGLDFGNLEELYLDWLYLDKWDVEKFKNLKMLCCTNMMLYYDTKKTKKIDRKILPDCLEYFNVGMSYGEFRIPDWDNNGKPLILVGGFKYWETGKNVIKYSEDQTLIPAFKDMLKEKLYDSGNEAINIHAKLMKTDDEVFGPDGGSRMLMNLLGALMGIGSSRG